MPQHKDIGVGHIHPITNWNFDNTNQLNNADVDTTDIHKVAYVSSNSSYYFLINTNPTWVKLLSETDESTPGGPAGGGLGGTYPNPIVLDDQHRHTEATLPPYPTTLPPKGPAGGDLVGTYPNPSLKNIGVSAGTYNRATVSVDSKGRVTAITSNADPVSSGEPFPGFSNVTLTGSAQAPTMPYSDISNNIATTKYVSVGQIRTEELPSEESLTILTNRQKVVEEKYTVRGILTVKGRLKINAGPVHEVEPNFLAKGARPLYIPPDYFKIVCSGYKLAAPIYIYGTLKVI